MKLATVTLTLLIAACNDRGSDPAANGIVLPALEETATRPMPARFAPDKVESMRKHFLASDEYVDLLQSNHPLEVEWQLGVVGNRRDGLDLARVACRELRDAGLADDDTDVRIVNVIALEASPGDFRTASLGHASCLTGDSLGA